ncbi:MAG: 7-cyano-7-deazaguanine synthase, partial [Planctomycetota bacterium]|nr:7-cyano-7-deazaguanine synthase [Planctomycetota bacterium]
AADRVGRAMGVASHVTANIDLRVFGGSALTADLAVPRDRDPAAAHEDIPITYVPARNLIFLAYAIAMAETRDAAAVCIGVNAIDYSGYPDCRPEFIAAFQRAANLGTKAGVNTAADRPAIRIETPLLHLSKADIIRRGAELGVDFSLTHSCYDPDPQGRACGHCDSCLLRRAGFEAAGVPDPTVYAD